MEAGENDTVVTFSLFFFFFLLQSLKRRLNDVWDDLNEDGWITVIFVLEKGWKWVCTPLFHVFITRGGANKYLWLLQSHRTPLVPFTTVNQKCQWMQRRVALQLKRTKRCDTVPPHTLAGVCNMTHAQAECLTWQLTGTSQEDKHTHIVTHIHTNASGALRVRGHRTQAPRDKHL